MRTINLTEYTRLDLPPHALGEDDATLLWQHYHRQVRVDFPSPKTAGQWRLSAQGWVGTIPLRPDLTLRLLPKVPLDNLLRMWEVANALSPLHLLDGLVDADSLDDVYAHLAHSLARRVLVRARQGLQRAYLPRTADLPVVRGRLDTAVLAQRPAATRFPCRYSRFSADIPDNQILAYTLDLIARGGRLTGAAHAAVRQAHRALRGTVTPRPFAATDCAGRTYTRLTADYRAMHALCSFFLSHSGPGHQHGDRQMVPFLIDMARLYERFVAAWLRDRLPSGWRLRAQDSVSIAADSALRFQIDLTLVDASGRASAVLDTKYKAVSGPAAADAGQIIAYAKAQRCTEALLVYPAPLERPLDTTLDDLHIRTLTFDLGRPLAAAGEAFLAQLALP